MKSKLQSKRAVHHSTTWVTVFCLNVFLTSCSGDGNSPKSSTSHIPTHLPTSTPPPTYSSAQVKARLLTADEIGNGMREVSPEFLPFQKRKAPSCSLSGISLPSDPELIFRQYSNRARHARDEVKYAQLTARFDRPADATKAYNQLKKKAYSCPSKQYVPPRRVRKNYTLFPHNDTWKVSEGTLLNWSHLRGSEKQVIPRRYTKHNVLYYTYDYALRGNLVIATAYWERAEPGQSGSPAAQRATEILKKQLKKFG